MTSFYGHIFQNSRVQKGSNNGLRNTAKYWRPFTDLYGGGYHHVDHWRCRDGGTQDQEPFHIVFGTEVTWHWAAAVCVLMGVACLLGWPRLHQMIGRHKAGPSHVAIVSRKTLTIVVPAHNEENGLGETLESFLNQTVLADRIVVVADNCTDRTVEVALSYPGVECLVTPKGIGGSKAKAQNYGLSFVDTDLVLPVDADTTLDPDYIEHLKPVFEDPKVTIAAGCVLTKESGTVWEKGRTIEYLYGFTFHRPVQHSVSAPVVCSGCCSVFATKTLQDFGGFPERTIVEDMDYTWSQQIAGNTAVYVPQAVARAADPKTLKYMRVQMWRWMAGFFQNVRMHFWELLRFKKWLAFWVGLAVLEIVAAPLWYLLPFAPFLFGLSFKTALIVFFGAEAVMGLPVLVFGAFHRKIPLWKILLCWPCLYANRVVNLTYAWKALVVELVLVPLKLKRTFLTYEMGR